MRELVAAFPEAALPYLELMARNDPHREVREAAAATLAMMEPAARRVA
jgi:hypothetical protein